MRTILFSIFILLSIQLSCQNQGKNYFSPQYSIILFQEKGEEMMAQCSRTTPEHTNDFFIPTDEDILLLDNNFKKLLSLTSTGGGTVRSQIERLEDYGYQYIGVNINNRRYIYINAFFIDIAYEQDSFETWYKEWKTQPIIVCDGGNGFWGILFDIESKSFSQFAINGVG